MKVANYLQGISYTLMVGLNVYGQFEMLPRGAAVVINTLTFHEHEVWESTSDLQRVYGHLQDSTCSKRTGKDVWRHPCAAEVSRRLHEYPDTIFVQNRHCMDAKRYSSPGRSPAHAQTKSSLCRLAQSSCPEPIFLIAENIQDLLTTSICVSSPLCRMKGIIISSNSLCMWCSPPPESSSQSSGCKTDLSSFSTRFPRIHSTDMRRRNRRIVPLVETTDVSLFLTSRRPFWVLPSLCQSLLVNLSTAKKFLFWLFYLFQCGYKDSTPSIRRRWTLSFWQAWQIVRLRATLCAKTTLAGITIMPLIVNKVNICHRNCSSNNQIQAPIAQW